MPFPNSIQDNLRFLLVEVSSQLTHLSSYCEHELASASRRILDRSGYAYNLKMRIQDACIRHLANGQMRNNNALRSLSAIAGDMERIAELCRDCVQQLSYLSNAHKINLKAYLPLINLVQGGVKLVESALFESNTQLALKLGKREEKLDSSYAKLLQKYTKQLKGAKQPEDLVTALFVASKLEQMGDSLLKISESIISSNIGQPIDMQRFQSLQESLAIWKEDQDFRQIEVSRVAETRSGSGISSIKFQNKQEDTRLAIYKDGEKRKLKEELDGLEKWQKIYPGITPEVLSYRKSGQNASLLMEHLGGDTFENIVLNGDAGQIKRANKALKRKLHSVWGATKKAPRNTSNFITQLNDRIHEVYKIHPEFQTTGKNYCGVEIESFESQLAYAHNVEKTLSPPFQVFIHGDFNVDNILFDQEGDFVKFIDVHRSKYSDYVQDVSVFMVSNYRLQVFDRHVRNNIRKQIAHSYQTGKSFAKLQKDDTFELRLGLGLVRSFISSTRFIMDKAMAKRMYLRALYIIELIKHHRENAAEKRFSLPVGELFSE